MALRGQHVEAKPPGALVTWTHYRFLQRSVQKAREFF
jgi:hypothetical protein